MIEKLDQIVKKEKIALLIGVLCVVGGILLGLGNKQAFFESWLVGFIFCVGMPFGAACITAVHFLSHGKWGFTIRKPALAAMRTFPLLALYSLPVLFGIGYLYGWTNPEIVQANHMVQHKIGYLNPAFFGLRTVIYFIVWIFLAIIFERKGNELLEDVSEAGRIKLQRVGGLGILVLVFTGTFASFDWAMSVTPEWFSTIYGILSVVSQSLLALCVLIITAKKLLPEGRQVEPDVSARFHELGNLMLALVMLWMYMSFSQFFIIWSGNLPEEILYYIPRSHGGWLLFAIGLVGVHFFLPFFLLLNRTLKENVKSLCVIALVVLLGRFADVFWVIIPTFRDSLRELHILHILIPIGLFKIWIACYLRKIRGL